METLPSLSSGRVNLKSNKKHEQHHFEFENRTTIKNNNNRTESIEHETNTITFLIWNRTRNKHTNSRTEATTLQLLVFLLNCWIVAVYCSIVVYYSNDLWLYVGGCPGALGPAHRSLFHWLGYLFFSLCSCTHFFKNTNTFVTKFTPKRNPKSIPKLALHQFILILCTLCFWWPAHFDRFQRFHLFDKHKKDTQNKALKRRWKQHDDFMKTNQKS